MTSFLAPSLIRADCGIAVMCAAAPSRAAAVKEEMEFINETCLTTELRSAAVRAV